MRDYQFEFNDINNWDEGLAIGNGRLGSIIYSKNPLRVTIDRADLWDLRVHETTLTKDFNYKNLVKLSKSKDENDWKERDRLFEQIYIEKPYPSKITAGRLELEFDKNLNNPKYVLDIKKANVKVYDCDELLAEIFMTTKSYVGVIKLCKNVDVKIHIPNYISNDENGLKYPQALMKKDGNFLWYEQDTKTDFKYGIALLKDEKCIYYTLITSNDNVNYIEYAKSLLLNCQKIGAEKLQQETEKWWKSYWKKSSISLDDKLIEDTYYKSMYLFGSGSRKGFYPMALQGLWTADNDKLPPWRGDYHHDTNTQLTYQSFLKANRLNEGKVFVDYMWKYRNQFKKFAKDFYGVKGLLIPGVSTLDGKPMGGWSQYALSPTMTIWSIQSFDEYYIYTGDANFLKNRAYPIFKEVGNAIRGILQEKNGKLYLPLSTSPEIHDDTVKAYLEPNSNFDLALIRYLYLTLIKYCEILSLDKKEYVEILSKLDDIAMTCDKQIMLDKNETLEESHRHFSHYMCLYPLHLINYDSEDHKKIYKRAIFDIERLGTGMWVGFSFAMASQIYAMAYKGNSAYEMLYKFCNGFVGNNGFHLNGDFKEYGYSSFHYRPFTLESSFGFCDALQEMLLQNHKGYIELFPAIPEKWKKISFKNLLCDNGVSVSADMKNGDIQSLIFYTKKSCDINVKLKDKIEKIKLQKGKNRII